MKVPDWVGVPERRPEEERERPGGSVPPTLLHVYGGNPPVASNVYEYDWFCVPSGRGDVEVMVGWEEVVILNVPSESSYMLEFDVLITLIL